MRAELPDYHHPLEISQFFVPRFRDRLFVGFTTVKDFLPFFTVSNKVLLVALISFKVAHTAYLVPRFICKPGAVRIGNFVLETNTTGQEEHELVLIQLVLGVRVI